MKHLVRQPTDFLQQQIPRKQRGLDMYMDKGQFPYLH